MELRRTAIVKQVVMKPRKTELLDDVLVNSLGMQFSPEPPFYILSTLLTLIMYTVANPNPKSAIVC